MFDFVAGEAQSVCVTALFIEKYMSEAPGDYVKVYLYGLYLAQNKLKGDICGALKLSEAQIADAIDYWRSKGAVETEGGACRFVLPGSGVTDSPLYESREYIEKCASLLCRTLSTQEIKLLLDITGENGLSEEVALKLIAHIASPEVRGSKVAVRYIEKAALAWVDEGIDTSDKADDKIRLYKASVSGLTRIMRTLFGYKGRTPNEAEEALYAKWTDELGFSPDALFLLAGDAALSANPSMKYLDAMVRAFYEKGIISATDIENAKFTARTLEDKYREVLEVLQYARKYISPELRTMYEQWTRLGFSHEAVLLACGHTASMGNHSIKKANSLIREWHGKGIIEKEDILRYLNAQSRSDRSILQMFELADIKDEITDTDRKNYERFTDECGMSADVLLFAAEISSIRENPKNYMYSLLYSWSKKNIDTLEKAQKLYCAPKEKAAGGYEQRDYSGEFFESKRVEALKRMEDFDG